MDYWRALVTVTEPVLKLTIYELPLEIIDEIARRLPDEQTQSQFALTCRLFHDGYTQRDRLFTKLLTYVLSGEQVKAEWILKRYPDFLLRKIDFTDPWTKKTFNHKSVFQYAFWAKDRHMYNMMLDCLPQNEQGEEIRKGLLEQAKELTEHFDFTPLIRTLQIYVDNFVAWGRSKRTLHWCTVVGLAQQNLPVHVRQEYCNPDRLFYPVPDFTEPFLIRSLRFYNWASSTWMNWDCGLTGLGSDFAIGARGSVRRERSCEVGHQAVKFDLKAVTALSKVRTADLSSFMQRLQTSIQKPDDVQAVSSQITP